MPIDGARRRRPSRRADRRRRQRARHRAGRVRSACGSWTSRRRDDWPAGPVPSTMRVAVSRRRQRRVLRQPARRRARRPTATDRPATRSPCTARSSSTTRAAPGRSAPASRDKFRLRASTPTARSSARPARSRGLRRRHRRRHAPGSSDRRPGSRPRDGLPRDLRSRRSALGFEDDGPRGADSGRRPTASRRGRPRPSPPPDGPVLENSFVSSPGWVKPGETTRSRCAVKNYDATPRQRRRRSRSRRPDGTTLAGDRDLGRRPIPAATADGPGVALEGGRGEGRHARPGPADRLEGPLHRRDAHLRGRPADRRAATARR